MVMSDDGSGEMKGPKCCLWLNAALLMRIAHPADVIINEMLMVLVAHMHCTHYALSDTLHNSD